MRCEIRNEKTNAEADALTDFDRQAFARDVEQFRKTLKT